MAPAVYASWRGGTSAMCVITPAWNQLNRLFIFLTTVYFMFTENENNHKSSQAQWEYWSPLVPAIQLNKIQYDAIQCNSIQYNQYYAIPCNTMKYHTVLYKTIKCTYMIFVIFSPPTKMLSQFFSTQNVQYFCQNLLFCTKIDNAHCKNRQCSPLKIDNADH